MFNSLYPMVMNSMGMKASSTMSGESRCTLTAMNPSVAARLYAGAVDATPMMTLDSRPSAPDLSPFSTGASPGVISSATLVTTPPRRASDSPARSSVPA